MKKVLFVSNVIQRITNFTLPSIKACKKLGFEFHLAGDLSNFKDQETAEKLGIYLHHVDLDRNPFSIKNIKAYRQLMRIIDENSIEYIHCNTPIGGVLGRLCGATNPRIKKVIYTAHGFHFYKGAPLFNNIFLKSAEKIMSRFTDVIITMNSEDYKNAQSFKMKNNKGKVYYVPGVGVDTKDYQQVEVDSSQLRNELSISEDDFLLISTGELIKRKNYSTAIKAIAEVETKQEVHLLICGTGPEYDSLMKLAKNLNIQNQIHFLGFRSDIRELLSISDAFIFTSRQEGLPRSLMEAMSSGLPCIVSNIRGNVDLIKEDVGGKLKKPNDVQGFSKAIKNLIDHPIERKSMGEKNIKKMEKFDVNNVKKEILNIYKNNLIETEV